MSRRTRFIFSAEDSDRLRAILAEVDPRRRDQMRLRRKWVFAFVVLLLMIVLSICIWLLTHALFVDPAAPLTDWPGLLERWMMIDWRQP